MEEFVPEETISGDKDIKKENLHKWRVTLTHTKPTIVTKVTSPGGED